MDDKFLINVRIIGKPHPLRIKRCDEELVRAAATELNQLFNKYRERYERKSDLELSEMDFLSMAALHLSIEKLQLKGKNDTSPITDKIVELTGELENYLKDK